MVQLIKQRLKTKQTVNLFLSCLKELCAAHPDNLATILKHTIFNELSQSRNPNNMQLLGVMFQVNSERAASALANVFLELLLQKDCYLRALRILLREIVRCVRISSRGTELTVSVSGVSGRISTYRSSVTT